MNAAFVSMCNILKKPFKALLNRRERDHDLTNGKLLIFIQVFTCTHQDCYALYVDPTARVGSLKSTIFDDPCINTAEHVLLCGKELMEDDNKSLEQYGIEDKSTILVVCKGRIHITVFMGGAGCAFVAVQCFDTVGALKDQVWKKTGMQPRDQLLTTANKVRMEDEESRLLSYGMVDSKKQYILWLTSSTDS